MTRGPLISKFVFFVSGLYKCPKFSLHLNLENKFSKFKIHAHSKFSGFFFFFCHYHPCPLTGNTNSFQSLLPYIHFTLTT